MFSMSDFLRAIQKNILHLLQWFWRILIMTLAMLLFREVLAPPACPPPCLVALASSPSPSSHFLPPSRATQTIVSACVKRRGGKGAGGVRTNAQRLGLPEAHRLPTERYFLPQQQSWSAPPPPPPWPCWRFPAPKCSISCLWSPPKHESQNCWQEGEKEKGIY